MLVPEFRVMAWNTTTRSWTVRSAHDSLDEAQSHAEKLQHELPGLRVRVRPAKRRPLKINPAVYNATRRHREEASGRMIERQDATKRYKSMG
jgi:hypothetical protein